MPLGIGFEQPARLLQRQMLADAGDDVLQRAAFGRVIEHVVDGDQRHEGSRRQYRCRRSPAGGGHRRDKACCAASQTDRREHASFRRTQQRAKPLGMDPRRRHDNKIEAFNMIQKIRQSENAVAFLGASLSEREQPREPSPGGAIAADRPGYRASHRRRPAARQRRVFRAGSTDSMIFLPSVRARAQHRRRSCGRRCRGRQGPSSLACSTSSSRIGSAAQKGKIGGDGQLGIRTTCRFSTHANKPCRYQRGTCAARSRGRNSPSR